MKKRIAHSSCFARFCLTVVTTVSTAAGTSVISDDERVLIKGAPLIGGSNGMYFDSDNYLNVAQVFGRAISKLDTKTGDIVEHLSFGDLVAFPDDLIFSSNGTLYYTDPEYFKTILKRLPGGPSVPLLEVGSVPFVNAVTLSADETKLFYAQCWNIQEGNSLFELDLITQRTKTIVEDAFGCASNAMSYRENALYTPRPFEGRVVRVDLSTDPPSITNVTTGMMSPNAVKFNSNGHLFVTDTGSGEVSRVYFNISDLNNNREVLAKFPSNSIDNLAFDKDDRLFVSSASDAAVYEVLSNGGVRVISPPGMSIPMGLALVEKTKTLYTLNPQALYSIKDAKQSTIVRSAVTLGPLAVPTSLVAWDERLVLMSAMSGLLMVWNLDQKSSELTTSFGLPVDAHPFNGDLLVTEIATGRVVRALSSDSFQTREVIAEAPGATFLFLAGNDQDVYVTDGDRGLVLQIISQGKVLDPPAEISTGLTSPEGIALHPNGEELLVIDAGIRSLLAIDILTGDMRTIATDLALLPGIPGLDYGYPNDVVVLDGSVYINGDGANVIYKIEDKLESPSSSPRLLAPNGRIAHLMLLYVVFSCFLIACNILASM